MITSILVLHIAAGSVALASMLIPAVTRKGGLVHRRAGWVFVASMAIVSITALVLSGARLLFDPRPEARDAGFFLFAVGILTASSVSTGVRVLQFKTRTAAHLHWWDTGLPAVLTVFSAALGVYGLWRGQVLFMVFAGIGLVNGIGALRYWLRPPSVRMHWWFEHLSSMLGGCIAAVTAFMVNTADTFGIWPLAAWLAPSIIGTPAIIIWTAYYRRFFSERASSLVERPSHIGTGRAGVAASRISIEGLSSLEAASVGTRH
jgi:hypothetical protein